MVRLFRVGGLRFLRIGRFQVSWCMVKRKPTTTLFLSTVAGGRA